VGGSEKKRENSPTVSPVGAVTGHLASQESPWAPYVRHETLGRTVHVGPRNTKNSPPDTQAINSRNPYAHTSTRQTSNIDIEHRHK